MREIELGLAPGPPVLVAGSAQRWFAPGFTDRDGDTAGRLLQTLSETDAIAGSRLQVFAGAGTCPQPSPRARPGRP